ncbi:MAG: 2Fe-2S iron-sulfur cluster-binding protein [Pseudolabrys sp.]
MRLIETWTPAIVRAVTQVTPTIRVFDIVPEGLSVRGYPPGGHLNVGVMIDGRPDTRSYSIVGADGCYRIAVKRAPDSRGGSQYMWSLSEGARLTVSNAKSNFPLDFGWPGYHLIAAGIGITPIVGMALALAERGEKLRLAYAARTVDEFAFADDLQAALGTRMTTYVSGEGRRLDVAAFLNEVPPGDLVMICGPLPMIDEARRTWKAMGRAATDLRFETFGSSGGHAPEAFTVKLPQFAAEIAVAENQSMLDALNAAGFEVISDCRRGECGVCAVNILDVDGEIDHRDVFFSEHQRRENKKMCVCVSRAVGAVSIDAMIRPDPARPG